MGMANLQRMAMQMQAGIVKVQEELAAAQVEGTAGGGVVKAVVTGADTPGYIGLYLQDRHIFATDRVRYIGDPVAGVVAASEEIAEQACKLVQVEYEPLPAVFDPEGATRPDAPRASPRPGTHSMPRTRSARSASSSPPDRPARSPGRRRPCPGW